MLMFFDNVMQISFAVFLYNESVIISNLQLVLNFIKFIKYKMFFAHLFTHIGKVRWHQWQCNTTENLHETCILQIGFCMVSNHMLSIMVYSLNQVV